MNIIVTGFGGFVGRALCRRLRADGHAVTGFDAALPSDDPGFPMVRGNLVTGEGIDLLPWTDADAVIHLAAAGVKAPGRQWPICVQVNILGTMNLLRAVERAPKAIRLVYAHTFYEDFVATNASLGENPYVLSKFVTTRLVSDFGSRHRAGVFGAKLFQIYGPGDAPGNLVPHVASQLARGEKALIGSGAGLRDWLHVDDLAAGLEALLRLPSTGTFEDYDLGSGELVSIRQNMIDLADQFGPSARSLLDFDPARDRPDVDLAACAVRRIPGWTPSIGRIEGLKRLADAYRK